MSMLPSGRLPRAAAALAAVLLAGLLPHPAAAQLTRTLTACTSGALAACAELRLTAGPSLFEIGIRTLGATGQPLLPVSVYNLVLGTGAAPVASGGEGSSLVPPVAVGGASLTDASPWDVFDTGDALFLSSLTNFGVGGCAAGTAVGGFGQAGRTCGAGQFLTFGFVPTGTFDVRRLTVLNLEAVALTTGLPAGSCGGPGAECVVTNDVITTPGVPSTVPEPATLALVAGGLLLILALRTAHHRRD